MNRFTIYEHSEPINTQPDLFVPPSTSPVEDPYGPPEPSYNGLTIEDMRNLGDITKPKNDLDKTALALEFTRKGADAAERLQRTNRALRSKFGNK